MFTVVAESTQYLIDQEILTACKNVVVVVSLHAELQRVPTRSILLRVWLAKPVEKVLYASYIY